MNTDYIYETTRLIGTHRMSEYQALGKDSVSLNMNAENPQTITALKNPTTGEDCRLVLDFLPDGMLHARLYRNDDQEQPLLDKTLQRGELMVAIANHFHPELAEKR